MINLIQFAEMETPGNYGWFHIMFIMIMILLTFGLCFFFRNVKDKSFRIIIGIFWVIFVSLELYKQFTYVWNGTEYQWYAFPFQFCSTPLYVLPFIVFLPEGKVRQAFIAFTSLFVLFGGLAVYAFPNDVFTSRTGINIQTMIHHGFQIVTGIYVTIWNRKNFAKGNNALEVFISLLKYVLKGAIVFAGMISIAIFLNEGIARWFPETSSMNMFFISTHADGGCTLPILSSIYPNVHPVVFILIYYIGFNIVACIMALLQFGFVSIDKSFVKLVGPKDFKFNAYKEDYESLQK